jgi:membrane-associated phospholipid phosphatase
MPAGHAYTAGALPRTRSRERTPRSDAGVALLVAAACAVAMLLIWAVFEHVAAFELRDATLLHRFTLLDEGDLGSACDRLLHLLEPGRFVIWGVGLVLVALARERPRVALAVVVVMALAPLSSEILKPLLAHPHPTVGGTHIGPASWPSGHATAATALALSVVLVTPARWRAFAAVFAATLMLAVGFALLVREWHLPSDVLGGYLMGTLWTALAVACLRGSEARLPRRVRDRDVAPPA